MYNVCMHIKLNVNVFGKNAQKCVRSKLFGCILIADNPKTLSFKLVFKIRYVQCSPLPPNICYVNNQLIEC